MAPRKQSNHRRSRRAALRRASTFDSSCRASTSTGTIGRVPIRTGYAGVDRFERALMGWMTTAPGRVPRAQPFGIGEEQRGLTPTAGMGRPRWPNGAGESIRGAGHFIHGKSVHGITFQTEIRTTFRREVSYTPAASPWQNLPARAWIETSLRPASVPGAAECRRWPRTVNRRAGEARHRGQPG